MIILQRKKKVISRSVSRRYKGVRKSQTQISESKSRQSEVVTALPLWLAVDAEGGGDRVFAWKTLRGF
jgi:hypothetical protein